MIRSMHLPWYVPISRIERMTKSTMQEGKIPTAKELGYNVVSSAFGGLFAPKGLAPDIVAKADAACEKAVADERFRKAARQANQEPVYRKAADFAKMLNDDYAIKGDVVKRANIKG